MTGTETTGREGRSKTLRKLIEIKIVLYRWQSWAEKDRYSRKCRFDEGADSMKSCASSSYIWKQTLKRICLVVHWLVKSFAAGCRQNGLEFWPRETDIDRWNRHSSANLVGRSVVWKSMTSLFEYILTFIPASSFHESLGILLASRLK